MTSSSLIRPTPVQPERVGGYDPAFLGTRIDAPRLDAALEPDAAPTSEGRTVVDHTHFSLQMSVSRRLAFWVAWNIDGGSLKSLSRKGIPFVMDPEVATAHQVGDELYARNDLDRGHLARRADLVWGTLAEAGQANRDSFFFTNITPQMDDFNQSTRAGIWGRLEDAVFADVEVDDLHVSVFGGPVFQTDDRHYRGVQLPREYWKVIAFQDAGELKARGFLLTQNLERLEILELDEFRVFQVSVAEIEQRTRVHLADVLRVADTVAGAVAEGPQRRRPLADLDDIHW